MNKLNLMTAVCAMAMSVSAFAKSDLFCKGKIKHGDKVEIEVDRTAKIISISQKGESGRGFDYEKKKSHFIVREGKGATSQKLNFAVVDKEIHVIAKTEIGAGSQLTLKEGSTIKGVCKKEKHELDNIDDATLDDDTVAPEVAVQWLESQGDND